MDRVRSLRIQGRGPGQETKEESPDPTACKPGKIMDSIDPGARLELSKVAGRACGAQIFQAKPESQLY